VILGYHGLAGAHWKPTSIMTPGGLLPTS
jgi:hypothetical protein